MQRLEVLETPLTRRSGLLGRVQGLLTQHWRLYDAFSAAFANIGLALGILDYELSYSDYRTHRNCHEDISAGQVCRWLNLVFTLIAVGFLLLRHQTKLKWVRKRAESHKEHLKPGERPRRRFWSFGLVLELVILLLFPYPYLTGRVEFVQHYREALGGHIYSDTIICYTGGETMLLFMFGRLFFLLRSLFECVPYQNALAEEVCAPYRVKANIRFSIKCLFKMQPMLMILLLIVCSIPFISFLLRITERPFNDISTMDLGTYSTAMWCTAVTMATIGYGDYYPYTSLGRLICALTGAWGAAMFSVIVFVIQDGMDLSKRQNTCFLQIRKVRAAGKAVLQALRYHHALIHFGPESTFTVSVRRLLIRAAAHSRKALASIYKFSYRREEEITELSAAVADIRTQLGLLTGQLGQTLRNSLHKPINSSFA